MNLMRTMIPTVMLLAGLLLPGQTARAQAQSPAQLKIATMDLNKLLGNYYKTKLADADLEQRKAELTKELKDMSDGLDKAEAEYKTMLSQAGDAAISDQERERRKQTLSDKAQEIKKLSNEFDSTKSQANVSFQDLRDRMRQKLLGEIQVVVNSTAKAAGYSLVLNSSSDAVLYSKGDSDLTTNVLAQLNAGAPIDLSPDAGTNHTGSLVTPPAVPGNP
jgi:Skp family chaperone for outer membrane proteins